MSKEHVVRDVLHEATHHVPGVPEHQENPDGHRGPGHHGGSVHAGSLQGRDAGPAPAHDRPPRVLVGWQSWIAGLFSRQTD